MLEIFNVNSKPSVNMVIDVCMDIHGESRILSLHVTNNRIFSIILFSKGGMNAVEHCCNIELSNFPNMNIPQFEYAIRDVLNCKDK